MKTSPFPENEKERLEAMQRYDILDSEEDPDFNAIVELAALICNTSMSIITLLDEKRQWFKARKGLSVRETARDLSFCAHALHYDDIMIVEDALLDERFSDNPLVTGEPHIRFYAGIPLIVDAKLKAGTLAVIDSSPRKLTLEQRSGLQGLAKQVVNLLNLRYNLMELKRNGREREFLANIVQLSNDAILSIDQLGLIRTWNKGAEALYGYRREEVLGKSIHHVVRGDIIPFDESFEKFFHGEKVWRGEVQHLHKDNTPIYLLLTVSAIPMVTSDQSGYVLQLRDISERKRLEQEVHALHQEAMHAANERYRKIFENSLHGIFQYSMDGKFIAVNPAMASIFGYGSPAEMMHDVKDAPRQFFIDPVDRQQIRSMMEEGGRLSGYEFRAMTKSKKLIWIRAYIQVVEDKSGTYLEGVVEDVTERKMSEEKLALQFDEMKKINYELDRFVYSVSHDLRAPLSSILGITNIAEMDGPSEIQKKYLLMIRDSVQRLDDFIKDILSHSRNARMDVEVEKIDFRKVINEVQKNLLSMSGAERLQVTVSVTGEEEFYSDAVRIGIILNNLFSNVIKYQDSDKGESRCDISVVIHGNSAEIWIRDNGIGIPPELLDKVFDMFYRAHDISKGSGLGLYIARETVMKLRGTITVESVYGEYTIFKFVLPNLLNQY